MNETLREIAEAAGAPAEVIDTLWFNIFCQNFAHLLLELANMTAEDIVAYTAGYRFNEKHGDKKQWY